MAQGSPGTRYDPLTAFCFELLIVGLPGFDKANAYFRSIGGLKSESEVVPYKEGGVNVTTHQLVGPTKWPNLVLKRGFTSKQSPLLKWRESFLNDSPGRKLNRYGGRIIQLDSELKPVCHWTFARGWPAKWEGPDFDASKSELSIETLEIAHEGLTFAMGGG